jgi:hypothetical protein
MRPSKTFARGIGAFGLALIGKRVDPRAIAKGPISWAKFAFDRRFLPLCRGNNKSGKALNRPNDGRFVAFRHRP